LNQMSLDITKLRSADNIQEGGNLVIYDAGSDTLATVLAANYFDGAVNHLDVDDVIQVTHAGGVDELKVSAKGLASITVVTKGGATAGITADVSSIQGGGPLTSQFNEVTTVGTAGDAVTLPAAQPGLVVYVRNAAAVNSMDVFPALGDSINALADNLAFAMAAGVSAIFWCADDSTWYTAS
jgi:hypothetical protein